jgi:4-diphosphocytidyl-2-C-methyl-D-erythritol kinase
MISFPNCKINLGLHILNKREDGFHNLETFFYPLPLHDALEIIQAEKTVFTSSGLPVPGNADDNICLKAYHLLKKYFAELPPVKIHLHKTIPMGAGLGGGSADGAFTLKLLNEKINLDLSPDQLTNYALLLGSDCPFFIVNKPCMATGRGEVLKPLPINLSAYKFLIVNPGIHVNTGWAFSQTTPAFPEKSIAAIIQQPIETWKEELKNDFEEPVLKNHPEIKNIKDELYKQGAIYASMSGSGSTVFGIFKKEIKVSFNFPVHYYLKELHG